MDIRLLLLAIPWALLGTTLRSQNWDWFGSAHWNPVHTDAAQLPQSQLARCIVTGNFSGHFNHDVAMLLGTEVAFCSAPSIHNHAMKVAPPAPGGPEGPSAPEVSWDAALGLGVVPREGSYRRDLLAIATANGLFSWSVDTGFSTLDTRDWQSVCVGDLDGYAPDDFVGLSATSTDIIRVCLRREGYEDVPSNIALGSAAATKIVLAQWGAQSGPLEICVATTAKLWIGNAAGMVAEVAFANDGNGQLARTRVAHEDRLTWLGQVSGQKRLRVFWSGDSTDQDATWIGTATDLGAADWNSDQVDDLIVARTSGAPLLVFGVPTLATPYTPTGSLVMAAFTDPQPTPIVWPAAWIGDLNGDSVADLFTVSRYTSPTGEHHTTLWPCRRIPTPFVRTRVRTEEAISIISNPATGLTGYEVHMDNSLPLTDPMPTHMELLVYQGDTTGNALQTNPAPFRRVRVPYIGVAITKIGWRIATASAPESFMGAVRWVHVADGATTHAWPSTLFVMGIDGAILPYAEWIGPRIAECNLPSGMVWPSTIDGYSLRRPLSLSEDSDQHNFTGDDGGGTGDLPPPPPDPPRPPTPPPPPPPQPGP